MEDQDMENLKDIYLKYITEARQGHPHWNDTDLHRESDSWHQRNGLPFGCFPYPWTPIEASPPKPLPYVLLTGAGFSKGWGGLLVYEMTARVLSSRILDTEHDLRQQLLSKSYEEVLADLRRASMVEQEVCLTNAIEEAYTFQDSVQCRTDNSSPSIGSLMQMLIRPALLKGFAFFTLNHDLLVERKWPDQQMGLYLTSPGIEQAPRGESPRTGIVNAFNFDIDIEAKSKCLYIKLHGSINWREEINGTTTSVMVAGDEKERQIRDRQTPAGNLLRKYFEFFKSSIGTNTTVIAIGYSFSDEHINRVLAREGVRLVVINPTGCPSSFAGGSPISMRIRRNILGLWPNSYQDIFGQGPFTNIQRFPRAMDFADCIGLS